MGLDDDGRDDLNTNLEDCLTKIDKDVTLQHDYEKVPILVNEMKVVCKGFFEKKLEGAAIGEDDWSRMFTSDQWSNRVAQLGILCVEKYIDQVRSAAAGNEGGNNNKSIKKTTGMRKANATARTTRRPRTIQGTAMASAQTTRRRTTTHPEAAHEAPRVGPMRDAKKARKSFNVEDEDSESSHSTIRMEASNDQTPVATNSRQPTSCGASSYVESMPETDRSARLDSQNELASQPTKSSWSNVIFCIKRLDDKKKLSRFSAEPSQAITVEYLIRRCTAHIMGGIKNISLYDCEEYPIQHQDNLEQALQDARQSASSSDPSSQLPVELFVGYDSMNKGKVVPVFKSDRTFTDIWLKVSPHRPTPAES